MIKMQIIGHLGRDCTINDANGKSVMNFTVAHSEKFKDAQGNQKEKTIWVDCAYWSDRTAVAAYLKKGTQVHVDGQPDIRTYQKQDGSTGVSLTLRVGSVQLLGSKEQGETQNAQTAQNAQSKPGASDVQDVNDDLPF